MFHLKKSVLLGENKNEEKKKKIVSIYSNVNSNDCTA